MIRDILEHWRATAAYLILAAAVAAGFVVAGNLSDAVEAEARERRQELCEAINGQREVLVQLVHAGGDIEIPPGASAALKATIIQAREDQEELRELARDLLAVRDCNESTRPPPAP